MMTFISGSVEKKSFLQFAAFINVEHQQNTKYQFLVDCRCHLPDCYLTEKVDSFLHKR